MFKQSKPYWSVEVGVSAYGLYGDERKEAQTRRNKLKSHPICRRRYKTKKSCAAAIKRAGLGKEYYPTEGFDIWF